MTSDSGWGPSPSVPEQSLATDQFGQQPPVIGFHPLTLGELFEGTFAAIRSNPRTMFTISVACFGLVGLVAALTNALLFHLWGINDALSNEPMTGVLSPLANEEMPGELMGLLELSAVQTAFSILQSFAVLLVAGMLVLVVTNAVVGLNLNLAATWQQLRPRLWRLILTTLLVWVTLGALTLVLVGVVALPVAFAIYYESARGALIVFAIVAFFAAIAVVIWVGIRLSFATLIVVVENVAVGAAIGRSWNLTARAAWRLLGRYILLGILMGIVMSLLGGALLMSVMVATSFAPAWVSGFVGTLILAILAGFAQPVSSSYTALMYVDERIRKENLAPVLAAALEENRA